MTGDRRPDPGSVRDSEEVWKALSSPVRRRILDHLRDGPLTTGDLAERFPDLTRFAVMQHLRVLERGALVCVRREGRQRFNILNATPIHRLHEGWLSRYTTSPARRSRGRDPVDPDPGR